MSSVFVTGATGFVGRHLVDELQRRGCSVRALVRKGKSLSEDGKPLEIFTGDLSDSKVLEAALVGVDVVYHLAGVVTDWAPRKLYEEVHFSGTKNLIDAAVKQKVKRFVYISTVDVLSYEKVKGKIDKTTDHTSSKVGYRHSKVQAEKLLFEYAEENKIEIIIIRPVWVYGLGDKIFIPEIAFQMQKRSMFFIGSPDNHVSLIHVDNLTHLIVESGERDVIKERTFLAYDVAMTWKELINKISSELNLPAVKITLPYKFAHLLGHFMEIVYRGTSSRPPLTRTAVETIGINIEPGGKTAYELLAIDPIIKTEEGMNQVFDWIRTKKIENIRNI